MTVLIDKTDALESYTVQDGDTLTSIAQAQCPELGWKPLAGINFGTDDPEDVLIALAETIGVAPGAMGSQAAKASPQNVALAPHADAPRELKIPKPVKKADLAMKRTHRVRARRLTRASVIRFDSLDRWFVPKLAGDECELRYTLRGPAELADKVEMEVRGSNYAKCTDWKKGFSAFAAVDLPVFRKNDLQADADSAGSFDWDGGVDVAEGVFEDDEIAEDKTINAAFSPYNVLLRYRKDGAHPEASLLLQPFWPLWKPADGTLVPASLKLEWEFKSTGGLLKRGLLQIFDGRDNLVFQKPLKAAEMSDGKKSFKWDGKLGPGAKNSKNGDVAIPEDMPYRAQVFAHTPHDAPEALGLAAMHSEVRIYVDKETHAADLDPYDAATNKPSLLLSVADSNPGKDDLTRAADGDRWVADALSKAGFHCGPVKEGARSEEFKRGVAEFLRSVPATFAAPFARLPFNENGDMSAAAKTQLETLPDARKRSWFGKAADRSDYTMGSDELTEDLRDVAKDMILWVEDRFWYTDPDEPYDSMYGITIYDRLVNSDFSSQPKRHGFEAGDKRVKDDARDIVRPFIPLQVQPVLLRKTQKLDDQIDIAAISEDDRKTMARAVGPLRIDWTFDEIEPDPFDVPQVDSAIYHGDVVRTRSALTWALDKYGSDHTRKDVTRKTRYRNAPKRYGGARPYGLVGHTKKYYKAVWGRDEEAYLEPWFTKKDAARESVATVVHERVGGAQDEDSRFEKRCGCAGINFMPSRIAGDGYQLRAELRFDRSAGYKMPNAEVLEKRYPLLPQCHSAKLRNWRRTTVRAHLLWSATDNAGGAWPDFYKQYEICNVHFAIESDVAPHNVLSDVTVRPSALMSEAEYKGWVAAAIPAWCRTPGWADQRTAAWMQLDDDHAWPFGADDHWGIQHPSIDQSKSAEGLAWALWNDHGGSTWTTYTERMSAEVIARLEQRTGRMRGHVIVDFNTTPDYRYAAYRCDTCGTRHVFIQKDGTNSELGGVCAVGGCPGVLEEGRVHVDVVCTADPTHVAQTTNPTSSPMAIGDTLATCNHAGCGGDFEVSGYTAAADQTPRADPDFDYIPFSSFGATNGVSWNDSSGSTRRTPDGSGPGGKISPRKGLLWAHEVGHNRWMQHAGNAPGGQSVRSHHDTRKNPLFKTDPDKTAREWDRVCLMTYADQLGTYTDARDVTCMCFKCVLKNRGWRVESLSLPPKNLRD